MGFDWADFERLIKKAKKFEDVDLDLLQNQLANTIDYLNQILLFVKTLKGGD